jgi:hypothetical protein
MNRHRKWLWIVLLLPLTLAAAIDLNTQASSQTFTVNELAFTDLTNPLDRANFFQIKIPPTSGTPQVFTFRHTNGTTVEVDESGWYEIGPLRGEVTGGIVLGAVQTATGSTTIQVIAQRVQ